MDLLLKKSLLLLLNLKENIFSKIVVVSMLFGLVLPLRLLAVAKPAALCGLMANLIDLAMLSSKVVKNSEASS